MLRHLVPVREGSTASSATVRRDHGSIRSSSRTTLSARATADSEDVLMRDADSLTDDDNPTRFIVAVDYGTTYSSVAYVTDNGRNRLDRESINSIIDYPYDHMTNGISSNEVPTELWYSDGSGLFSDTWEDDATPSEPSTDGADSMEDILQEAEQGDTEEENSRDRGRPTREMPENLYWGYEMRNLDAPDPRNLPIQRAKLLLDKSRTTLGLRNRLKTTLNDLKNKKLIESNEDVITDFLTCLFAHTKDYLQRHHNLLDDSPVEIVLSVPAMWTPGACRKMHTAMVTAMQRKRFGSLVGNCIHNLFIISEPEAAASFVLSDNYNIRRNDTFVLLDAGGGTVDAITYTVDNTTPLRLKQEAVDPSGKLCGSSFLNEAFRKFLYTKLKDEQYLEDEESNTSIHGIIESIVIEFENSVKRQMDFNIHSRCKRRFKIARLRDNNEKKFKQGYLHVTRDDFLGIFQPILDGVASLMEEQIYRCRRKGLNVDKVVLIGGFADCPALVTRLWEKVNEIWTYGYPGHVGPRIMLEKSKPGSSATAVASGAVLRALNKRDGPERILRSSYGVLRKEPYQKEIKEHKAQRRSCNRDELDGISYITNTVDWVIKKGDRIAGNCCFMPLQSSHTFGTGPSVEFLCEEVLYVSETSKDSHYKDTHPKNKGAEIAGVIVVDMTFLRDRGLIQPILPQPNANGEVHGVLHYKVDIEIVIELDGRNMSYEARWPPRGSDPSLEQHGRCEQQQISIAAAFEPGTD